MEKPPPVADDLKKLSRDLFGHVLQTEWRLSAWLLAGNGAALLVLFQVALTQSDVRGLRPTAFWFAAGLVCAFVGAVLNHMKAVQEANVASKAETEVGKIHERSQERKRLRIKSPGTEDERLLKPLGGLLALTLFLELRDRIFQLSLFFSALAAIYFVAGVLSVML